MGKKSTINCRIISVDKETDWNEFFKGHLKLVNPSESYHSYN